MLSYAPQRVIAEGFETAVVPCSGGKFGGDEHPAAKRLAQRLDACDFVDRGPDYGEVEPIDSPDVTVEHLSEVEGEINRSNRLAGLAPRVIQLVDGAHRLGSGIERASTDLTARRVLKGKYREHAVAEEFQDLATARAQ